MGVSKSKNRDNNDININDIKYDKMQIKLILHYYIKECFTDKLYLIKDIENIIINYALYKYDDISWSKELKGDKIFIYKNNIIHCCEHHYRYMSCFLDNIINYGIHSISFKMGSTKNSNAGFNFWIGIYKIKYGKPILNDYFTKKSINCGYTFIGGDGFLENPLNPGNQWQKYGKKLNENDICEMIIDLKSLNLSYKINGIKYNKAFDIENTKYRVGCILSGQTKIQLLKYDFSIS